MTAAPVSAASAAATATHAMRGVAWTVATSISARALGLVGTLIVVSFVAPADFGVVSAASVLVLTANQLSTLGVGIYVISHPSAPRAVVFHATVIHLTLGVLALGVVTLAAPLIGPWLDVPTIARYVPGLALAILCERVAYMPERVLIRDMRFRRIAAVRFVGEVSYTAVSVAAAMAGWGGAAIVAGNLARSAVRLVGLVQAADRRDWIAPAPLSRATLRQLGGYGFILSVSSVATFGARRWDNLLVTGLFGSAVAGAYTLAYNLADMTATQVGEAVSDVLLPSFTRLPDAQRAPSLLRALSLLSLVLFPLAIGLGAVAPTVTVTFFRGGWSTVGPMLALLSALSVARPVSGSLSAYLQARLQPVTVMWLDLGTLAALLVGIVTVGRVSPLATCAVVGVVFIGRALANMIAIRRRDGVPLGAFARSLAPPLLACLPMVGAVLLARRGLAGVEGVELGRPWPLLAEVAAGALGYGLGVLLAARAPAAELLRLSKRALSRAG